MHVQRVGLNAETKKVLAPSRRGKFLLTFPFIGRFGEPQLKGYCEEDVTDR